MLVDKLLQAIKIHKNRWLISLADKMTSMMLGTFTNSTGDSSSPADYVMAGKTGTTEADFSIQALSDQWVVVIRRM